MATIGQSLTAPESGWKRMNADHQLLSYMGTWITQTNPAYSGGTNKHSNNAGNKISFTFRGTKLRYIGQYNTTSQTPSSISIDGVTEQITFLTNTLINSALVYEKTGLSDDIHTVVITINSPNENQSIQGIDIDSNGRLLHPDEVTKIKDLQIGKRIRCNYSVISTNTVGSFSGLGQETSDFIPATSTSIPNGDFYLIMVEDFNRKKILVADRNIQNSISWDTLNNNGLATGACIKFNPVGVLSGYESGKVIITDNGYVTGSYGEYQGWRAFDRKNGNGDKWTRRISANDPAELIIRFKDDKQMITALSITPPPSISSSPTEHPKHFKLQGSDDGHKWRDIFENSNGIGGVKTRFAFRNSQGYSYYRFSVLSSQGGSQMQIGELEFESESIGYEASMRLLTGGTSATDDKNEWDKYIVNSTLNSSITAGDNNVWNWRGILSWSSTTLATHASQRVLRGDKTNNYYFSYNANQVYNTCGFRPVVEIKILPQIKSFILANGEYMRWEPGKPETKPYSPDTIIPKMTSNTAPYGLAFADTEYGTGSAPWKAFDQIDNNEGYTTKNGSTVGFLGYIFDIPLYIGKYVIRSVTSAYLIRMPKVWTFEGSNDTTNGRDGTWFTLDTRTNQSWSSGFMDIEFTIDNPQRFKAYRLNWTENNGNASFTSINELKMYSYTPPKSAIPPKWETVSTILPNVDTFISEGMDDLSILDRKPTSITIPMDDNTSSGEVLGRGKMYKERLNKYIDIKKINVK
ncbi:hypothetical protein JCM10914A_40550 [Paenibacillus sp. JCM 10914]|uniref:hypothetical protein n=1 Tax=Paenibacillus sp. JCM 10914 TaxID=1236974 RepID=UPI0003CC47A5|nr:hypothetical protein [Paenibacillus sp. JCM 10914]GAE05267.1 hypothetical protein JCM10914_1362 [Paenibacillus sp. JCM 10914]